MSMMDKIEAAAPAPGKRVRLASEADLRLMYRQLLDTDDPTSPR
jgi:hypothetical protein